MNEGIFYKGMVYKRKETVFPGVTLYSKVILFILDYQL